MFKPGDQIGKRYRVKRILGKGGQVQVYLCEDEEDENKLIVLKELIYKSIKEKDRQIELALFEQEARILQQISHRNLPKVYRIFSEDNLHFICEEFIEGNTLDKQLKKCGGKLNEKDVLNIAMQLVSLLEHLHTQDPPIIIRDIKPQNMILNDDCRLYFIDFTIARYMVRDKEDTVRMGSPGYAPPEQYRGLSTPQSDIYAMGVTLHQLLTGHNPINTPFTLPPCRKLRKNINSLWESIICKATDLDPAKRYQSISELKEDLYKIEKKLTPKPSHIQNIYSYKMHIAFISIALLFLLLTFAAIIHVHYNRKLELQKTQQCQENITKIFNALTIYAEEHRQFPRNLQELVPTYISHLPPCPAAHKFNYTIEKVAERKETEDGKDYTVIEARVVCKGNFHKNAFQRTEKICRIIE